MLFVHEEHGLSVSKACTALRISRSMFLYKPTPRDGSLVITTLLELANATRDTDLPNILLCCVARDIHGTISARLPNLSAAAVEHAPQKKTASAQPSSRPSGGANRRQRLLVCGLYERCADARSACLTISAVKARNWSRRNLPDGLNNTGLTLSSLNPANPRKTHMWSGSTASSARRY